MTGYWLSGAAGLALGAALLGGVQQMRVWAGQAELAKEQKALADQKTQAERTARLVAEATARAQAESEKVRQALQTRLENADADAQTKLTAAKRENDELRNSLAIGTRSLRVIGARCNASASAVPEAAGAGGVVDAEPELGPEVRERVLDLRQALIEAEAQIKYLQDYARSVSAPGGGK